MVGLPVGQKTLRIYIYNGLDTIPACHRQTDRQTFCDGIVRAMHTRHAVKIVIFDQYLAAYIMYAIQEIKQLRTTVYNFYKMQMHNGSLMMQAFYLCCWNPS